MTCGRRRKSVGRKFNGCVRLRRESEGGDPANLSIRKPLIQQPRPCATTREASVVPASCGHLFSTKEGGTRAHEAVKCWRVIAAVAAMPLLAACAPVTYGRVVIASEDRIDTACLSRVEEQLRAQGGTEVQGSIAGTMAVVVRRASTTASHATSLAPTDLIVTSRSTPRPDRALRASDLERDARRDLRSFVRLPLHTLR